MAELATIARPYADALFKAAPEADQALWIEQVSCLAQIAADPQVREFAQNPKVTVDHVVEVISGAVKVALAPAVTHFLRAVLENGRLAALPEMAGQFQALVRARQGVSEARIISAFPMSADQVAEIVAPLERRFGRKLTVKLEVDAELIGGVRVQVGDEVLDTSVKARLERMKSALVA